MDVPVRFHRHYPKCVDDPRARHLGSDVIMEDAVPLAFEGEADPLRPEGPEFGVDAGPNAPASLSDGRQFGTGIYPMVQPIQRCLRGSSGGVGTPRPGPSAPPSSSADHPRRAGDATGGGIPLLRGRRTGEGSRSDPGRRPSRFHGRIRHRMTY